MIRVQVIAHATMAGARAVTMPLVAFALLTSPVYAAAQMVTVVPATGLGDGATVHVHASGFTPGASLAVEECSAAQTAGEGDCAIADGRLVRADSRGDVDATLRVWRGPFGLDGVLCRRPPGCAVSVSEMSFHPKEAATAPITFAYGPGPQPGSPVAHGGTAAMVNRTTMSSPLLALVPALLTVAFAALILRRRRDAAALAVAAAGGILLAVLPAETFAVTTAMTSQAGVNAAELEIAWAVGPQVVAILVLVFNAVLRRRAPPLVLASLAALGCAAALVLVAWPAVTVLGGGPASEGAGAIWFGTAAGCVIATGPAVAACLMVARRHAPRPPRVASPVSGSGG